jgi:glycosyltransferase involved in cell wall biosynthesis
MGKALQKHCDVFYLGPTKSILQDMLRLCKKTSQLLGKNYDYSHSVLLAKSYARFFTRKLSEQSFDLLFAPAASTEIAFLNTDIPIMYLSDATFASAYNYNPAFSNLLNISIREGNTIEGLAISKADLILYPTEWAAQSAIKNYNADKTKIRIIPFGANIDDIPSKEIVLKKKKSGMCRLLFLAARWKSKGGDIAFETLLKLEEFGVQAELIVCGCTPPSTYFHKRMLVIPFLNKNDERQRKKLANLLSMSDFLLLPTRSEAYGIVFCEANAFGLPAITTDTGGVSGVIKNGENGFMLSVSAGGLDYAKVISEIYQDEERYYELVRSSRKAFDERLNWNTWAVTVKRLTAEIL